MSQQTNASPNAATQALEEVASIGTAAVEAIGGLLFPSSPASSNDNDDDDDE